MTRAQTRTMARGLLSIAACALALGGVAARGQEDAGDRPVKISAHDKHAAAKQYVAGAHAIEAHDAHTAYDAFSEAASLDPTNPDYKNAASVARAHFVTELIQQADEARIRGQNDVSHARLAEAFAVDPNNPMVAQHQSEVADALSPPLVEDDAASGLGDELRLEPAPGRHSFHLRADGQSLIRQVLSAYGIAPSFDASVSTPLLRMDVDDVDFLQAEEMLRLETNTFFVPLDPHRVLVAKDTKENRTNYERLSLETYYLPGLNNQEVTEIGNLARNVLDIPQVSTLPSSNTMTVRGPRPKLLLLNHTLTDLLNGHSQVMLEVKVYEIAHTRTTDIGVQLPSQFSAFNLNSEIQSVINSNPSLIQEIISSGLANAGDLQAIAAILLASGQVSNSILTQPFAIFGGGLTATGVTLGTVTGNLALNSSDSRAIDQVQLRLQDNETGSFMAGLHYPIIQSTYSNLTGTGVNIPGLNTAGLSSQLAALGLNSTSLNQQTIPQVQYQDLGLQMKATPHIHRDQSVALKLELKVQALGTVSLNSIPEISNREFTANLDLKDGESALVTSNLSSSETMAISGLPFLSEIPGLQSTTNKSTEHDTDELVILIVPHVVRMPHPTGASQVMLVPTHQ